MDALDRHLENLTDFGTLDSVGSFTLAPEQAWDRLEVALEDGRSALRYCLRWLHRRGASSIEIRHDHKARGVSVRCSLFQNHPPIQPIRDEDFDYSGQDIDLGRGIVSLRKLGLTNFWLEYIDTDRIHRVNLLGQEPWENAERPHNFGILQGPKLHMSFSGSDPLKKTLQEWRTDCEIRFRHSPVLIRWNNQRLSKPYVFSTLCPVWRRLLPKQRFRDPVQVTPPSSALESYHTTRHESVSVVLGLCSCDQAPLSPSAQSPTIHLLIHGEMFPLKTSRNLAGFEGFLRIDDHPLTIEGHHPVFNSRLKELLVSLKEEALDMVVQLFRHEPPLTDSTVLEQSLPGITTVLLHLAEQQRFIEGFQICQWLKSALAGPKILTNFRAGYTLDKLSALMAEPAGQPQTALRWNKEAERRVSEGRRMNPGLNVEALLIAASLEIRARNGQAERLTADTQNRMLNQAIYCAKQNRHAECARLYRVLGNSLAVNDERRWHHLTEAGRTALLLGRRKESKELLENVQAAVKLGQFRPRKEFKQILNAWQNEL